MFSGQFGTNNIEMNYNRRMNKSIQRRLLERELGLGSYDDRRRNNDLITQVSGRCLAVLPPGVYYTKEAIVSCSVW